MVDYIFPPLSTDPDDVAQDAFDYMAANIPGWLPNDAQPEVWLLQAAARLNAETRDVASSMLTALFEAYGQNIIGLQPIAATYATTTTTWNVVDTQGYTIPAGTQVAFKIAGDQYVPFLTVQDVVIAPGEAGTEAGAVQIQSVYAGAAYNNLGPGNLELMDPLVFVSSITVTGTTTGGDDGETVDQYRSRLIEELRIQSPRPIFGADAAILARRIAGVWRATGIDNYDPMRTATDVVTTNAGTVITSATIGFIPSDVGRTITGAGIPANTTIQSVTNPTTANMSAAATADGTGVTITLAERTGQERMIAVALVDQLGNPVTSDVKAAVASYLEGMREVNFVIHVFDPTYTTINVMFTIVAMPGYDAAVVRTSVVDALTAYINPATWGIAVGDSSLKSWVDQDVLRFNDVIGLMYQIDGVQYVSSLTLNGGTTDVALAGPAALPVLGTVN